MKGLLFQREGPSPYEVNQSHGDLESKNYLSRKEPFGFLTKYRVTAKTKARGGEEPGLL